MCVAERARLRDRGAGAPGHPQSPPVAPGHLGESFLIFGRILWGGPILLCTCRRTSPARNLEVVVVIGIAGAVVVLVLLCTCLLLVKRRRAGRG